MPFEFRAEFILAAMNQVGALHAAARAASTQAGTAGETGGDACGH